MNRIILPKNIDLLIVSSGGVGTTFLIDFFSQFLNTNNRDDTDNLKHSPLPPISFKRNVKYIYVFGNPLLSVASLFRRGFQHPQSKKLQRWSSNKTIIPENMRLSEYVSLGTDLFQLETHFLNWYENYQTGIPTLFIRYEAIHDNIGQLLEFTGISKDAGHYFPQKKERKTTVESIPREIATKLDSMYGELANRLEKLNDVEIVQRGNRLNYLNRVYAKAVGAQMADYFKITDHQI